MSQDTTTDPSIAALDPMRERLRAVVRSRVFGDASEPVRIGRYPVLKLIGSGGLGVVYAAYDPELDRKVAIKLVRPDRADASQASQAQARLVREAQATAKLSHPNVIVVHEVGTLGDQVFLVMELVEGQSLRDWIHASTRSWREQLHVFVRAGRGLAAAHAAGVVHRDFKPDNVLVDRDDRAVVVDFGLATAWSPGDEAQPRGVCDDVATHPSAAADVTALTRTGAIVGTPAYMAPEQFRGDPVDARSDQFSFCVALWEALCGERPFAGETLEELSRNVLEARVREVGTRGPPRWVHDILRRGLCATPDDRFASMDDLIAALGVDHGARLRRRVGVAVVLSLGAVALGGMWLREARHEAACEAAGAEIEQVWNPQSRQRVGDALAATGAPYAEQTVTRVEDRLDAYASAWAEGRAAVCTAARGSGGTAAEIHDAAVACFEQRRHALSTLADVLAAADADIVQRAVAASSALPPVAQCRDTARLLAGAEPPRDQATRDRVTALRSRLTRAATLESAGRFDDACAEAEAVRDEARGLDHPAFLAEALARVGTIEARRGHVDASREALEEAFFLAGEAGDDQTAADAASELVWTIGYEQARHAEGLQWGRIAKMLLVRLGADDSLRMASLLDSMGSVRDVMGQHRESVEDLERALEIREDALGPVHPLVGMTAGNLGIAHHSLGNAELAMQYKQRSLDIAETALGAEHPFTADSVNAIAVQHIEGGQLALAKRGFERVLQIRTKALGKQHPLVADVISNIGNVDQELGDLEQALKRQREALAIYQATLDPDHPLVGRGMLNLGSVELDLEMYAEALDHERRALEIRSAAYPAEHPAVATASYFLGVAQIGVGDHTEAMASLQRVIDASAQPDLAAAAKFHLARARDKAGLEPDRTLELARQAREGLRQAGDRRAKLLAQVEQWLADHD